jgi:hypothetical protein
MNDSNATGSALMRPESQNNLELLHALADAHDDANFADGAKVFCGFRQIKQTRSVLNTRIQSANCSAQFFGDFHAGIGHMFKDQ